MKVLVTLNCNSNRFEARTLVHLLVVRVQRRRLRQHVRDDLRAAVVQVLQHHRVLDLRAVEHQGGMISRGEMISKRTEKFVIFQCEEVALTHFITSRKKTCSCDWGGRNLATTRCKHSVQNSDQVTLYKLFGLW